jgi:hypothetical protein
MRPQTLTVKDAAGAKKTISPSRPLPVAVSNLSNVDLGTLERYARLGLYGLAGIGILQAVLIMVLIFVRR